MMKSRKQVEGKEDQKVSIFYHQEIIYLANYNDDFIYDDNIMKNSIT